MGINYYEYFEENRDSESRITNLEQIKSQTQTYIYPNPSSDIFKVSFGLGSKIEIKTKNGKLIEDPRIFNIITDSSTEINLSEYPNGVYLLEIQQPKGEKEIYKLIKIE